MDWICNLENGKVLCKTGDMYSLRGMSDDIVCNVGLLDVLYMLYGSRRHSSVSRAISYGYERYVVQLMHAFDINGGEALTLDGIRLSLIDGVVIGECDEWICIDLMNNNVYPSIPNLRKIGNPLKGKRLLVLSKKNDGVKLNLVYNVKYCNPVVFSVCLNTEAVYMLPSGVLDGSCDCDVLKRNILLLKAGQVLKDNGVSWSKSSKMLDSLLEHNDIGEVLLDYGLSEKSYSKLLGYLVEYFSKEVIRGVVHNSVNDVGTLFKYSSDILRFVVDNGGLGSLSSSPVISSLAVSCDRKSIVLDIGVMQYVEIALDTWTYKKPELSYWGKNAYFRNGYTEFIEKYAPDYKPYFACYLLMHSEKDTDVKFMGFNFLYNSIDTVAGFVFGNLHIDGAVQCLYRDGVFECILKPFIGWCDELLGLLEYSDLDKYVEENREGIIGIAVHFLIRCLMSSDNGRSCFTDVSSLDFKGYVWRMDSSINKRDTEIIITYKRD